MIELNVNIDHVATVRNARGGFEPSPFHIAKMAIENGAEGIVCHLREDRRHIKDDDVFKLRELDTRLDLEMATAPDVVELAFRVKPDLVTIVPEKREELTTEGGLNTKYKQYELSELIKRFRDNGIIVSLFIEPNIDNINDSLELKADMVEFHTGHYANEYSTQKERHLKLISQAVDYAKENNLRIAAGHGLDYNNTFEIAKLNGIDELSIGHSIISKSIYVGIEKAVRDMKEIIRNAQSN